MTIQDVAMIILLIFILFASVSTVMNEPPAQPEKAKRNSEDMSDDQ